MSIDTAPLHPRVGKTDAVSELATRAGIPVANSLGPRSVPSILEDVRAKLSPVRNENIVILTAEQLGLKWMPIHSPTMRPLAPAIFTNGRPTCFGDGHSVTAFSPRFKVLSIKNGYVGHFFGATLVISPDRSSIVEDVSSRYGRLFQYYDSDATTVLKEAPFIDGIVIPITDDIRPLNFCHWLVDWLPRLEFLGFLAYKPTVYVVTTPLIAQFQRDLLRMCGFDESRVIALDDYSAVRARELLIPGDLRETPHPIFKGAPWALSYLRSTVGMRSIMEVDEDCRRREKLYISRADARRRRIVNDLEFAAALEKIGYRVVQSSGLSSPNRCRGSHTPPILSASTAQVSATWCSPHREPTLLRSSQNVMAYFLIRSLPLPWSAHMQLISRIRRLPRPTRSLMTLRSMCHASFSRVAI